MTYNQGRPLRADPMKPMVPQLMIAVGQPTFVPRMAVPAALEAYVPGILSLIQIEIESKMGQGPIRMHAHNLVAANEFRNEEFAELADIVLKYIDAQMLSGAFQNIQQAVNATVSRIVGMWSAAQVRMYPQLMEYLTPQHQQLAMEAVDSMAEVVSIINRFSQGNAYNTGGYQGNQGNQGGYSGGYGQQGNGGQLFHSGNDRQGTWGRGGSDYSAYSPGRRDLFQGGYDQAAGNQPRPNYSNSQGGSGLFRTGSQSQQPMAPQIETASAAAANMGTGKMSRQRIQLMRQQGHEVDDEGNVTMPESQQLTPPPQQQQAQPSYAKWGARTAEAATAGTDFTDVTTTEAPAANKPKDWDSSFNRLASLDGPPPLPATLTAPPAPTTIDLGQPTDDVVTEKDWAPSETQQYHPAWTSATQACEYHKLGDGTVVAVIVQLSEQEKQMNENEHAIGSKSLMRTAFERQPDNTITRTETPAAPVEPPPVSYTFVNNDDVQIDVSERTTAMIAGVVGRASGQVKAKTDIWHTTTWVVEPVLCANQEVSEYLDQLTTRAGESTTFTDLIKVMKELTGQDEVALRARINQTMTRAINDQIAFNISPKVYIDNFESDWADAVPYLRKKHGDRIVEALLGQQREIIRANIMVAQGEDHETMNGALLSTASTDSTVTGAVTYLACRVTHSHMQYTAEELSLAVPRRGVALLTEQNTPLLEAVAQEMFSGKFGTAGVVARRFIVTIDGLVLQVARSLLNPSSFLVRVID
jgi:hypothetical protein